MDYTLECSDRKLMVRASGSVSQQDVAKVEEILVTLTHMRTCHAVVLDMKQVKSVDSDGLRILMDMVHQIPARGHVLYLSNAQWFEKVLETLDPEVELSQVA